MELAKAANPTHDQMVHSTKCVRRIFAMIVKCYLKMVLVKTVMIMQGNKVNLEDNVVRICVGTDKCYYLLGNVKIVSIMKDQMVN